MSDIRTIGAFGEPLFANRIPSKVDDHETTIYVGYTISATETYLIRYVKGSDGVTTVTHAKGAWDERETLAYVDTAYQV